MVFPVTVTKVVFEVRETEFDHERDESESHVFATFDSFDEAQAYVNQHGGTIVKSEVAL